MQRNTTPPAEQETKTIIRFTEFDTPLGVMCAAATDKGICMLCFASAAELDAGLQELCSALHAVALPGRSPLLDQVEGELIGYFEGSLLAFSVPLDMPGTAFQQSVWAMLQEIPYARTCSYKEQSLAMGKPDAIRAIAAANGQNRVAIIVPCHRVIGSDGKLTGYAGGLHRKQWLLDLERRYGNNGQQVLFL